jgi:hypothetical protein
MSVRDEAPTRGDGEGTVAGEGEGDERTTDPPAASTLPTPDRDRQWSLSDLLWLLDGDWEVTSATDRIVTSNGPVSVVVTRSRGVYRVRTRIRGLEYNEHQSVTLRGALAGVRRDLRREGF